MKYCGINFTHMASCFLLMLVMPAFLMSCGGKAVKPVSPEAKLAQEAFSLAETLRAAYAENDRSALATNSTSEGYKELSGVIKAFDKVELSFTPTWVEIRDKSVYLTVSWKGVWLVKGKTSEERGQAIFALEGTPLKLAQIQRANPFKQPE